MVVLVLGWTDFDDEDDSGQATRQVGKPALRSRGAWRGQRRGESGGNYIDMETGESFWISGVKLNGKDRHWAGSGKVLIEAAALTEYLATIKAKALDASRCEITHSICQTNIERLSRLANALGKGWPDDPAKQTAYSFVRNVTNPR